MQIGSTWIRPIKDRATSLLRSLSRSAGVELSRYRHADLGLYDAYPESSRTKRQFYNVGAGSFSHPFWTNVDYASAHYRAMQTQPFLQHDLMQLAPLPIASDTAEAVYCSHTIEHISDAAVEVLIAEASRILKPGGYLRLTTVDAGLEYAAYKRQDIHFYDWLQVLDKPGVWEKHYTVPRAQASIHQLFLHHFASQLCSIDTDTSPSRKYDDAEIARVFATMPMEDAFEFFTRQCVYKSRHPGNHMNWFTYDKMLRMLQVGGFKTYYRSAYGQSCMPPMRETQFFDSTFPALSLYVEAIK